MMKFIINVFLLLPLIATQHENMLLLHGKHTTKAIVPSPLADGTIDKPP